MTTEDRNTVLTAWVQHQIEAWRTQSPPRTYQWVADRLGCSKPHAVNLHNGKSGAGPAVEARVAATMFGGSHDAFYASALEWWHGEGSALYRKRLRAAADERAGAPSPDPPELRRAVSRRDYLPETVAQARLRARPGVTLAQWEDYLDGLDRENRRFDRGVEASEPEVRTAVDEAVKASRKRS